MDMEKLEKQWRKSCPEEASGLVSKRTTPKRWVIKLQAHKRKKKQATQQ
jgi:hypothetical protein